MYIYKTARFKSWQGWYPQRDRSQSSSPAWSRDPGVGAEQRRREDSSFHVGTETVSFCYELMMRKEVQRSVENQHLTIRTVSNYLAAVDLNHQQNISTVSNRLPALWSCTNIWIKLSAASQPSCHCQSRGRWGISGMSTLKVLLDSLPLPLQSILYGGGRALLEEFILLDFAVGVFWKKLEFSQIFGQIQT